MVHWKAVDVVIGNQEPVSWFVCSFSFPSFPKIQENIFFNNFFLLIVRTVVLMIIWTLKRRQAQLGKFQAGASENCSDWRNNSKLFMWMEAAELMHRNTHVKRASHKETSVVKEVGYVPVMIPCSLEHLPKEKFDIKWGSAVTIFLEEFFCLWDGKN